MNKPLLLSSGSIIFYTLVNGISPMPTSRKVRTKLLDVVSHYKVRGPVFELGSGWGTLAVPLAKALPDSLILAYENSGIPYLFSILRNRLLPMKNLVFIHKNYNSVSLTEAGLVVCYLYSGAMDKLKVKFERELKPGALIISHTFALPGWIPVQVMETGDLYRTRIYVYEAP
ncbi:SAM-dependent methyltransferase [Fibrobacterota bacterium]